MKILIDMNLSPEWVAAFAAENIESVHWSSVGDPRAADTEIIEYALTHGYIVFTHDLDFGNILALTHAAGPSVIQVRAQDILPSDIADMVISVIRDNAPVLDQGEVRARVRILPLEPRS